MIGRPTNVGMFFDPGICPVMTKNVPTSPRSFMSGSAILNWLIVESSYVMATAASLPSGHLVISVFGAVLRRDRDDGEHAEQKPGVPHKTNSIRLRRGHDDFRIQIECTSFRALSSEMGKRAANWLDRISLVSSEGLRPGDSPTRALARRVVGALRSRGSLAVLPRSAFVRSPLVSSCPTGSLPSTIGERE